VEARHNPRRHRRRPRRNTNGLLLQTTNGETPIRTAQRRRINGRGPLLRPDATAIDGMATAVAVARDTIARPGTVTAIVMSRSRVGGETTKKKSPSAYLRLFPGSLAHYRGRARLTVGGPLSRPPPFARFDGRLTTTFRAGPVFRTDDLMQVFRGAVIPSVTGRSRSPPPPPRSGEDLISFSLNSLYRLKLIHASRWKTAAGLRPLSGSGRWATTLLIMVLDW